MSRQQESGRIRLGHVLISGTALVLAAIAWLFFGQIVEEPGEERTIQPVSRVVLQAIASRDFDLEVTAVGRVRPWRQVAVAPEVGGRVVEIPVEIGDRVRRDDLLLRIDPDPYQDAVDQRQADRLRAAARLEESAAQLGRMAELRERGAISEQEYEAALAQQRAGEADLKAAEAALDRARRDLENTRVRAPFDGTVVERQVDPGALVSANREVLTVARLDTVAVEVGLTEEEVLRVTRSLEARVTSARLPDRIAEGIVDGIAESSDPDTGTYLTRIRVENRTQPRFLGGMVVQVRIPWNRLEDVLAVPAAAVLEPETDPHLFVVRDSVAWRQQVRVLARDADVFGVAPAGVDGGSEEDGEVAPLNADDRVVVVGQSLLSDGDTVEVVDER